jgi:DNA processing protein
MIEDSTFYFLALQAVEGIGCRGARKLLEHFGCPKKVLFADKGELLEVKGIGPKLVKNLKSKTIFRRANSEMEKLHRHKIMVASYVDTEYPKHLRNCEDAPLLLFFKGTLKLDNRPILSIVGTRKMTSYGASFLKRLFREMEQYDPVVVSGMAYGVDILAHRLALKHGLKTIGVLAHGMDRIYPRDHYSTALDMLKDGALITEFWTGTPPEKMNFVKRNRIIAGISQATLVAESSERGGSLITADLASTYNREVFAVPGRCSDTFSAGCNHLIKTHRASVLTEAKDLAFMLNWKPVRKSNDDEKRAETDGLSEMEMRIFGAIQKNGKIQVDQLCQNYGLLVQEALPGLMRMELMGKIRELPGKYYEVT